ncbi:hypothetical protein AB1Y20_002051 [Prymnesium parvum]|uniref:Eukaryotic translation initiation factor 3 subunit K n=1 Tax=Prymnesium parvum TaxID=97485 RepID=A0AB34J9A0_PRYPA
MAGLDAASCAALLEKQRYDPSILPQLEAYVTAQCASGTYDLEGNLATLKLYQFHPEKTNSGIVARILLKALMNLPMTDYLLCTYLISESVLESEPISHISAVASLLETCSFRAVWASLKPIEELLATVPGFHAAVQEFMLSTLKITYQAVPKLHVMSSLGLTDEAVLKKHVEGKGWTIDGDLVRISLNDDNTAKPKKVDVSGTLGYDQMTKILSSISS